MTATRIAFSSPLAQGRWPPRGRRRGRQRTGRRGRSAPRGSPPSPPRGPPPPPPPRPSPVSHAPSATAGRRTAHPPRLVVPPAVHLCCFCFLTHLNLLSRNLAWGGGGTDVHVSALGGSRDHFPLFLLAACDSFLLPLRGLHCLAVPPSAFPVPSTCVARVDPPMLPWGHQQGSYQWMGSRGHAFSAGCRAAPGREPSDAVRACPAWGVGRCRGVWMPRGWCHTTGSPHPLRRCSSGGRRREGCTHICERSGEDSPWHGVVAPSWRP